MSLHDRPSLAELLAAVRSYIADEVAPAAGDRRARFRALIAANVLAIAERELAASAEDALAEGRALERPERSAAATAYAREMVVRKLAVANPRFRTDEG
jgi:hypothetical protein